MSPSVHLNFLPSPEMKEMMLQAASPSLVDSQGSPWGKSAMSYRACASWPKGLGLGHLLSLWISTLVSPSDALPQFGDSDDLF